MKSPAKTLIALAVAALGAGGEALADESKIAEAPLRDVVVSAARIEQSTLEAPASVSLVSSDKIEASGVTRLGEALTAKTPSFYMRGGGMLGSDSRVNGAMIYSLRGQSQNRVKIMVDGFSLADASAGSLASLSRVPFGDIERIEVVPGVSSALYGSDAIGGVVNIISKVPTQREVTARYLQGFGDGERKVFSAGYRDVFENGLAVALGFTHEDYSGFAKSAQNVLPVSGAGTGATAVRGGLPTSTVTGAPAYVVGDQGPTPGWQKIANAKLYYNLDAKSKFFAGFGYSEAQTGYSDFNNYLVRANGAPLALPAANVAIDGNRLGTVSASGFWNSSNPNWSREYRYFAGYDGKLGQNYDLKVNIGYFDRDGYYVSPGTTAATNFTGGPGTNISTPNTTFDASAQLGFALGDKQYMIAGLARTVGKLDRKVYATDNWRTPESSRRGVNESTNGESRMDSLFLQDQIFLTPALTLYAGGRFDRWTTSGTAQKNVGAAPLGTFASPERSESAFSPKVSAVYRWTDRLTLRGSLGTAFRAPTNYDMYTTPTKMGNRMLIADPNLKPERARAWDVGVEYALPEQGFVKAAYYETVLTDMIYRKTRPYTGTVPGVITEATMTNAGEGRVRGIELSGEMALNRWLRGIASYSWTDARITRDDSGAGLQDKMLRYVPKNMASLALDARWQQWRLYWSAIYAGLQYSNEDNSDTVKGVYNGTSANYWLSNLRLSYQIDKHFKASAGVNNLFDKEYYEVYLMPGRNFYAELSAAF